MIEVHEKIDDTFAVALDPFTDDVKTFVTPRRSWLAIWLFVCETCEDLLTEDLIVSQENSIKMARRLEDSMKDGSLEKWQEKWAKVSETKCSDEDIQNFITFCGFSGGFQA